MPATMFEIHVQCSGVLSEIEKGVGFNHYSSKVRRFDSGLSQ